MPRVGDLELPGAPAPASGRPLDASVRPSDEEAYHCPPAAGSRCTPPLRQLPARVACVPPPGGTVNSTTPLPKVPRGGTELLRRDAQAWSRSSPHCGNVDIASHGRCARAAAAAAVPYDRAPRPDLEIRPRDRSTWNTRPELLGSCAMTPRQPRQEARLHERYLNKIIDARGAATGELAD